MPIQSIHKYHVIEKIDEQLLGYGEQLSIKTDLRNHCFIASELFTIEYRSSENVSKGLSFDLKNSAWEFVWRHS